MFSSGGGLFVYRENRSYLLSLRILWVSEDVIKSMKVNKNERIKRVTGDGVFLFFNLRRFVFFGQY